MQFVEHHKLQPHWFESKSLGNAVCMAICGIKQLVKSVCMSECGVKQLVKFVCMSKYGVKCGGKSVWMCT